MYQTVIDATKTLVHAFINSRLDYCNQLFVGVSGQLLHKLQYLQNAAAHLVMGTTKFDHITPVRQRLKFKTAFLAFKCLRGLTTVYLINYYKQTVVVFIGNRPICFCVSCLFHGQVRPTVTAVSPFVDHLHGTVYLQLCDQLMSLLRLSEHNWKHFCLTVLRVCRQ